MQIVCEGIAEGVPASSLGAFVAHRAVSILYLRERILFIGRQQIRKRDGGNHRNREQHRQDKFRNTSHFFCKLHFVGNDLYFMEVTEEVSMEDA